MTFPLQRIPEITANPSAFALLEQIPLMTKREKDFPITLAPAWGTEITVVIVDVETTGFDPVTCDIIELGLTEIRLNPKTGFVQQIVRVGSYYQDPGYPIPENITQITGITDEMVRGTSISDDVLEDWFSNDPLVIAHNAKFDRNFVHKQLPSHHRNLRWACTMSGPKWNTLGYQGLKLEYLSLKAGYFFEGHRASSDCLATAWILHLNPEAVLNLLASEANVEYDVRAIGSPYDVKDMLSNRDYRWERDERYWHKAVPETDLEEEKAFLAATYPLGDQRAQYKRLDSRCRFLDPSHW